MIVYAIMIYVVFFVLFILTGIVSSFVTSNPVVLQGMVTVCSWTATIVLILVVQFTIFILCVGVVSLYHHAPIWQFLNFSLDILYTGDLLEIFVPFAVLYVLAAGVIVLWFLHKERSNTFRLALERNSVISE